MTKKEEAVQLNTAEIITDTNQSKKGRTKLTLGINGTETTQADNFIYQDYTPNEEGSQYYDEKNERPPYPVRSVLIAQFAESLGAFGRIDDVRQFDKIVEVTLQNMNDYLEREYNQYKERVKAYHRNKYEEEGRLDYWENTITHDEKELQRTDEEIFEKLGEGETFKRILKDISKKETGLDVRTVSRILAGSDMIEFLVLDEGQARGKARPIIREYKRGIATTYQYADTITDEKNPLRYVTVDYYNRAGCTISKPEVWSLAENTLRNAKEPVLETINHDVIFALNGVVDMRAAEWVGDHFEGITFTKYGTKDFEEKYKKFYYTGYNVNVNYIEPENKDELFFDNGEGLRYGVIEGIRALTDNENVRVIVFQILRNAIRGTNGNRFIILLNGEQDGSNGKSTLLKAVRNLIGEFQTSGLDLRELGGDGSHFSLALLKTAKANISDELEQAEKPVKAKTTKDMSRNQYPLLIDEKYKALVMHRWRGMTIQSVNASSITFDDKTDSTWRSLIVLRFDKHFTRNDVINKWQDSKEYKEFLFWYLVNRVYTPKDETGVYYDEKAEAAVLEARDMLQDNSTPTGRFMGEFFPQLLAENAGLYGFEEGQNIPPIPFQRVGKGSLFYLFGLWSKKEGQAGTKNSRAFMDQVKSWSARHGAKVYEAPVKMKKLPAALDNCHIVRASCCSYSPGVKYHLFDGITWMSEDEKFNFLNMWLNETTPGTTARNVLEVPFDYIEAFSDKYPEARECFSIVIS